MKSVSKFVILLLLALSFQLSAQETKSLLYKISGNGLQKPSYIYGTIHAACPENMKVTNAIKTAMTDTERLYLEVDMDDPKMMTVMMQNMNMKDGHMLSEYFTEAEYANFRKIFKEKTKIDVEALKKMKPFMISSMLIPALTDCSPSAWEITIMKMATDQKEAVLGLETINDQLNVFEQVPYEKQAKEIYKSLLEFDQGKKQFGEMVTLYAQQDIEALYAFSMKEESAKEYEKPLFIDRNTAWVEKMPNIMAEKPTFFGVGAGHLGGKNGVVKLLRVKGFKVEAIKNVD
jgi:uncharacterized protein